MCCCFLGGDSVTYKTPDCACALNACLFYSFVFGHIDPQSTVPRGLLDIYVDYLLNVSYVSMRVSVSPTSAAVRATALSCLSCAQPHSVLIDETERFGERKCYCNTIN